MGFPSMRADTHTHTHTSVHTSIHTSCSLPAPTRLQAFAVLDGRNSARAVLAFSGPDQLCPDPTAFVNAMENTFTELRASQQGGWEDTTYASGADALAAVLEAVRRHHVTLPAHICAVVVTTLVLEGWSNKLDPTHSVLHQVQAMFEPSSFSWKDRIGHVVDTVVERDDTATAIA
jgi:aarF domain-containing kinase